MVCILTYIFDVLHYLFHESTDYYILGADKRVTLVYLLKTNKNNLPFWY